MKMKRFTTLVVILAVLTATSIAGLAGATWWFLAPVQPGSSEVVRFDVPRGTSQIRLGEMLFEKKLTRHPVSLRLAVRLLGIGQDLQAGVYQLSPADSALDIAKTLTRNTSDIRVTIQEGLRAEEVVSALEAQLFTTAQSPQECLKLEGFLFPETYSMVPGTSVESACQRMNAEFESVWTDLTATTPAPSSYTQEELVTLASIIEREAREPEDMQRVAGVLYNRLEIGMALQVDATLQYAKGYNTREQTWWAVPLAADKNVVSPYNTYQNAGLPPGPISNPGRDALYAVLNPITSDNLYYISDSNGVNMYFAETYEEHQRNIQEHL